MEPKKQIGIWMDHSTAQLMELENNWIITNRIESTFNHQEKEHSLSKNENLMHNKEQQQQASYYKKISEALKGFNEIVLFGPTTAKAELLNLIKADRHFENVKIETKQADKMTDSQKLEFVKHYFHIH